MRVLRSRRIYAAEKSQHSTKWLPSRLAQICRYFDIYFQPHASFLFIGWMFTKSAMPQRKG